MFHRSLASCPIRIVGRGCGRSAQNPQRQWGGSRRGQRRLQANDPTLKPALDELIKEADKALTEGPFSVVNKPDTPPSGDKHDYMSLSPYWWPDPAKSDGLPYIRHDGKVNPDREKYDQPVIESFTMNANTLALAYYFTGDEKYAKKSADAHCAWFFDPATKMNPNCALRTGRARSRGQGETVGRAGDRPLPSRHRRRALLAGSPNWTSEDHEKLQAWFKPMLDYILTSEMGKQEASQPNNHGTWCACRPRRTPLPRRRSAGEADRRTAGPLAHQESRSNRTAGSRSN